MHRITSKRQFLTQNNVQFNGTLNAGYDLSYTYGTDIGKRFQLANVKDVNYRTEETPSESENVNNNHAYAYDANGNLVYVNTSRTKKNGVADEKTTERKLKWDEENRFVELESWVFFPLMFFLNLQAFGRCTGITFVDSTMIPVCHNLRRRILRMMPP